MTNASTGRVGVAPSLACCPVCGDRAALHQTRDDNQMCQPCLERYEAFCDREAAGWLRDEERGPVAMPDGLQDALYRYAVLRSTSN